MSRTTRHEITADRQARRIAGLRESLNLSREAAVRNRDNQTGKDWDTQVARYESRIAQAA